MDFEKINRNELLAMIKVLNADPQVEKQINIIGKKKADLAKEFIENVEKVPDGNALEREVILFYNKITSDEEEGGEEGGEENTTEKSKVPTPKKKKEEKETPTPKAKEKPTAAPKKEEKKEEKKPARSRDNKDEFGYVIGTGANFIDRAIIDAGEEGITKKEMETASGRSASSHLHAIKNVKGLPIIKIADRYYYDPTGKIAKTRKKEAEEAEKAAKAQAKEEAKAAKAKEEATKAKAKPTVKGKPTLKKK